MIQIFDDLEDLSQAAARYIFDLSIKSVEKYHDFSLALSGGETPRRTYEILSEPVFYRQMPWKNTHVFWGDERCLPPGDQQRNETMARNALLDTIPVPSENIYPIPCGANQIYAAEQYENTIKGYFGRRAPKFDLVLLGLGTDGHVASLFPGTTALNDQMHWVTSVYVPRLDMWRVSLTAPLINQARNILFLASGAEKAYIVRQALESDPSSETLPVHLIQPLDGQITWMIDKAASAYLVKQEQS